MFILINLATAGLIFFIIWWFWIYQPKVFQIPEQAGQIPVVDITIKGGIYHPHSIQTKENQPIEMRFTRKDPSKCAQMVIFPELDLSLSTQLNDPVTLAIPPQPAGTYLFTCEMGMYRGKLIVK